MGKFVDPFTDVGFKIVFGKENSSNEVLREFLNDLFDGQKDFDKIKELRYLNNERSKERLDDRSVIYDILCETENGHRFIVEMQRQSKPNFFGRAVYYVSRAIYEQGLRSGGKQNDDWDYSVIPVVGVFFCDFFVKGFPHDLVQHLRLCDTQTGKPVSNLMRYAFIQLPAFKKSLDDCDSEFDKWIYTLKNMAEMKAIPFTHRDVFERLAKISSVAGLSEDERRLYDYDVKKARDYKAEMTEARSEGHAIGFNEGRAEGRAAAVLEMARKMKRQGLLTSIITSVTGLSPEEISGL